MRSPKFQWPIPERPVTQAEIETKKWKDSVERNESVQAQREYEIEYQEGVREGSKIGVAKRKEAQ